MIHTNPQSASNWRTTRVRERVNKLTHEHSSRSSITPHYSHNQPRHVRWQKSKSLPQYFPRKLWHNQTIKLSVSLQTKGSLIVEAEDAVTLLPFDRTFGPLQLSVHNLRRLLVRRYLAGRESGSQNKLGMMLSGFFPPYDVNQNWAIVCRSWKTHQVWLSGTGESWVM